jgi:hypothetical protein
MKKLILGFFIIANSINAFSQAKKPTLMVVPSDVWCNQNGYMIELDNQGTKLRIPDYKSALQSNTDLLLVIGKINELMADRGFPLKNLESAIKTLQVSAGEDELLMSSSGAEINQSPIDKIKQVANADILLQITWVVNQMGPKKSVTFNLQGIDAYTDKQIAGASGTGQQSFTAELPVLLEEAVISHLDNFNFQLQNHFDDMFANGREIILRILTWNSWDYNLESTDFGDDELSYLIEDWVVKNSVKGRFNTSLSTENMMVFEQVRIPLFDESGRAIDARRWAGYLRKYLKDSFQIDAKLMMRGLGQAQLVLGDK